MTFDETMTLDDAIGRAFTGLDWGERWLFVLAGDSLAEARATLRAMELFTKHRLFYDRRLMELRHTETHGVVRVIPESSFVEVRGVRGLSFGKIVASPGIDIDTYEALAPCLIPTGGNFVGVVPSDWRR